MVTETPIVRRVILKLIIKNWRAVEISAGEGQQHQGDRNILLQCEICWIFVSGKSLIRQITIAISSAFYCLNGSNWFGIDSTFSLHSAGCAEIAFVAVMHLQQIRISNISQMDDGNLAHINK
ncbi:hypothetical protein [Croceibacterium xixiisoli]|uniref:hypothetical protein n=1 Tax=Croceibacterium xixiisoli TaxID=1476466 RepID=UPI00137084CC|nr:hypothetical protein [Croceibacterium xixiisoli]